MMANQESLARTWKLWYLDPDKNENDWNSNLEEVGSFNTMEGFRKIFSQIEPPNQLKHGVDYSLMKGDIGPIWEDPANVDGGTWALVYICKSPMEPLYEDHWNRTVLSLIREELPNMDEICGVIMSIREYYKIRLWTKNAKNESKIMEIEQTLWNLLNLPKRFDMHYMAHKNEPVIKGQKGKKSKVLYRIKVLNHNF